MKKKRIKKKRIRLGDIHDSGQFSPPIDPSLVNLLKSAMRKEIPVARATVVLADLEVHHPPTLERVRASIQEEPSLYRAVVETVSEERPCMVVYRNEAGRLVMFDDYLLYVAAQDVGLQEVDVQILGES